MPPLARHLLAPTVAPQLSHPPQHPLHHHHQPQHLPLLLLPRRQRQPAPAPPTEAVSQSMQTRRRDWLPNGSRGGRRSSDLGRSSVMLRVVRVGAGRRPGRGGMMQRMVRRGRRGVMSCEMGMMKTKRSSEGSTSSNHHAVALPPYPHPQTQHPPLPQPSSAKPAPPQTELAPSYQAPRPHVAPATALPTTTTRAMTPASSVQRTVSW